MSSTNVHSEQKENNIYCAGAQVIPTQREVEIPPKAAKKGPSSLDVILGENMEIQVEESELHKNGDLIAKDGTRIAKFDSKAFDRIVAKYNKEKAKSERSGEAKIGKGEDR